MTNNVNRIKTNMERVRLLRSNPAAIEIRLRLCDDELREISYNPRKCNPCGIWREGREFHLFTHAKATWAGGGWWDIKAPNRKALDLIVARLVGVWYPAPVQRSLPLPKPVQQPSSPEVARANITKLRAMLAGKRLAPR